MSAVALIALLAVADARADDVFQLGLRYTEGTLYNPMTGRDDNVRLRSYVGSTPGSLFVAPQIELTPGQLFRLKLTNDLPANDPSCTPDKRILNEPQCFNTTNLHLHGLWVSPSGNADNVLLSIPPGASFDYEYAIPPDHPAGTFFYHTHHHGSTAIQVSSGMAGAIIVRGNRPPRLGPGGTPIRGDVDTILASSDGTPFRERVVMLQQIPYACRGKDGKPRAGADGRWLCDSKDVGEVESYDLFGQSTWDRSGRFTGINGEIAPTFRGAAAGAIERWRVIHGGVRDSVTIEFRKLTTDPAKRRYQAAAAEQRRDFVAQNCTGEIVPAFSIALDGLTRHRVVEQKFSAFQPGYRQDLLVAFPEPGVYCIIDDENASVEATGSKLNDREVLGFVEVGPGSGLDGASPRDHVQSALIAAAEARMPPDVRAQVIADLRRDMSLAAFVPHADIVDAELTGTQTLGVWYFN
ncbi:MAG: hypothetical protein FJX59_17595, partial [Alphaproteobacteria bacterium]|nr:hypothetical protein [Alphaproteobacteria bacterium]